MQQIPDTTRVKMTLRQVAFAAQSLMNANTHTEPSLARGHHARTLHAATQTRTLHACTTH